MKPVLLLMMFTLCTLTHAGAESRFASLFQDHMVLQRDQPVPVWGTAPAGEKVTVRFAGQTHMTESGVDGTWRVTLKALKASAKGSVLEIEGGGRCEDVLVGDVWLLSGQSNMATGLSQSSGGREAAEAANFPWLRILTTEKVRADTPQDRFNGDWKVCTPQTINWFSAVGFYFALRVHEQTDVPIGLIQTAWAGSGIDPFITPEGFVTEPTLSKAADGKNAGTIYNSRVHPLIPMAMTGGLWYQGESNGTDQDYLAKMRALVAGWRSLWGREFPFYYVQISSWMPEKISPYAPKVGWAIAREAQMKALDIPRTGMVVTVDIGEGDLHPPNKQDVGLRLARWALRDLYGQPELEVSGPLYRDYDVRGTWIEVSFDHVGGGVVSGWKPNGEPFELRPDEPLHEFEIAGEDRVWHPADTRILGDRVAVASEEVPNPVAVRYAFSQAPQQTNLYNRAGLPASPFRTDEWPFEKRGEN